MDPLLQEKVRKFEEEYNTSVDAIAVKFVPEEEYENRFPRVDGETAAFCQERLGLKQIFINTKVTGEAFSLEEVVFHELGHCKFDLGHMNEKMEVPDFKMKAPASIMHKDSMNSKIYEKYRGYYRDQLLHMINEKRF